jgi:hypothetical protein
VLAVGVHLQHAFVAAAHREAVAGVQRGAVAEVVGVADDHRSGPPRFRRGLVPAAIVDDDDVEGEVRGQHLLHDVADPADFVIGRNDEKGGMEHDGDPISARPGSVDVIQGGAKEKVVAAPSWGCGRSPKWRNAA